MKNGIFKRRRAGKVIGFFWEYDDASSMNYTEEGDARKSYIAHLMTTPYGDLLTGKSYDRQLKIVFGAEA